MMQKFFVSLLLSAAVMSMLLDHAYGKECELDSDCGHKQFCDFYLDECRNKECEKDDDCEPKGFCIKDGWQCIDIECEIDDDCESGKYCERSFGKCYHKEIIDPIIQMLSAVVIFP
uniref:uncharacterized protein LOC120346965 n=1 Tax=Styela clava TaxID=7725 RepID=UPI0019397715|nr:uncharacterized protein LOC120346965 [Styela clava]